MVTDAVRQGAMRQSGFEQEETKERKKAGGGGGGETKNVTTDGHG